MLQRSSNASRDEDSLHRRMRRFRVNTSELLHVAARWGRGKVWSKFLIERIERLDITKLKRAPSINVCLTNARDNEEGLNALSVYLVNFICPRFEMGDARARACAHAVACTEAGRGSESKRVLRFHVCHVAEEMKLARQG